MNCLVLDDDLNRLERFKKKYPEAKLVETAQHCIEMLKQMQWDLIYLDHDLGGEVYVDTGREDNGSEVARFLAKMEHKQHPQMTTIICHSLNWAGRQNMMQILFSAGFTDVHDIPFTSLKLS